MGRTEFLLAVLISLLGFSISEAIPGRKVTVHYSDVHHVGKVKYYSVGQEADYYYTKSKLRVARLCRKHQRDAFFEGYTTKGSFTTYTFRCLKKMGHI